MSTEEFNQDDVSIPDPRVPGVLPDWMFTGPEKPNALLVSGHGMRGAGILKGDLVIIEECTDPQNGQVVLARVRNEVTKLRRWDRRGDKVYLTAAAPEAERYELPVNQVQCIGCVVGLVRLYQAPAANVVGGGARLQGGAPPSGG